MVTTHSDIGLWEKEELEQNFLYAVSYVYLLIPLVLFAFFWLKSFYAIIILILSIIALIPFIRSQAFSFNNFFVTIHPEIIVISLLWLLFSGVGGFGFQNGDYRKHNALLKDLISSPLPLAYSINETIQPLVYYTSWYLPAVLVGAWAGWKITNLSLFLWSWIGIILTLTWVKKLTKDQWVFSSFLFIFLSGADFLGWLLIQQQLPNLTQHLEWWTFYNFQYSSNTTLLYWVPQQAINGWLIISMILYESVVTKTFKNIPFLGVASLFSNPLQTIGLLPFIILGFIKNILANRTFKSLISFQNLVFVPSWLLVLVTYFASKKLDPTVIPRSFAWGNFAWKVGDKPEVLAVNSLKLMGILMLLYLLFYFLEVIFPFLIFWIGKPKLNTKNIEPFIPYLKVAFLLLLLLPIYRIGFYNDWLMRASIPSLFIIWIYFISLFLANFKDFNGLRKLLGIILVIIIGITPFTEIFRSVSRYDLSPAPYHKVKSITELRPSVLSQQYLGEKDTFFFRYLAKPLKPKMKRR